MQQKLRRRWLITAMLSMLALTCGSVAAEEPSGHQVIVPERWQSTYESFHYAPAVRAGDMLILSGVVAGLGPEGDTPVAAYTRAFELIGEILEEAGADWSDVVEIITYHTDLPAQIDEFAEAKDNYLKEPWPAWTAIDIDRLYPDNGLVEIKITAYLGE